MNFKLDLSAFSRNTAVEEAESFIDRRNNALIKHANELSATLRSAATMMMTDLWQLDILLDDQELGDKVLLKNTRHTFKYFCGGYSNEEAGEDPRILEVFKLFDDITRMSSELMTGQRGSDAGPLGHVLHTFGYKIVPGESELGSVIVGRNFRIVFG